MTKVKCLKGIISKLTGKSVSAIKGDTVCDCLHQLIDCVESKFIVNVTNDGSVNIADKTLAEIKAAHDAGKIIECHNGAYTLHPSQVTEGLAYFFCDIMSTGTSCLRTCITITPEAVSVLQINYELTPVD